MAKLIEVKRDDGRVVRRSIAFVAIFEGIPLHDDVVQAQQNMGFHPAGYGGPSGIVTKPLDAGRYEAKWTCWDNCD